MARLTEEQHADDRASAQELLDLGMVTTWRELGAAFGMTAQAAYSRFGKGSKKRPGYGLVMNRREPTFRRQVSVTLDADMDERLEQLRKEYPAPPPSRAQIVRDMLRERLMEMTDSQFAA